MTILTPAEVDKFERRANLWDYPRLEKKEMLRAVATIRALREGLETVLIDHGCDLDMVSCGVCAEARELLGGEA